MRILSEIPAAKMSAFCNVVEEKAFAAATTFGSKAYTRYEDISPNNATRRRLGDSLRLRLGD